MVADLLPYLAVIINSFHSCPCKMFPKMVLMHLTLHVHNCGRLRTMKRSGNSITKLPVQDSHAHWKNYSGSNNHSQIQVWIQTCIQLNPVRICSKIFQWLPVSSICIYITCHDCFELVYSFHTNYYIIRTGRT